MNVKILKIMGKPDEIQTIRRGRRLSLAEINRQGLNVPKRADLEFRSGYTNNALRVKCGRIIRFVLSTNKPRKPLLDKLSLARNFLIVDANNTCTKDDKLRVYECDKLMRKTFGRRYNNA